MDGYDFNVGLKVELRFIAPPENALQELKRSETERYFNYKMYQWINNKDNLRRLMSIIFAEDIKERKRILDVCEKIRSLADSVTL